MTEPVLDVVLTKRFGTREVLSDAKLQVTAGTVHALVGENGAGKSTLVKIVAGVLRGDGGMVKLNGAVRPLAAWTRQRARAEGVGIVQQHGAFAGTLTVVENAVLGVEPLRGPLLDLEPTAAKLKALGDKVGLPVEPHARADALSLGAAQRAEIVAALLYGAKILILDEPTAVLAPVEVDGLLATLRTLAEQGTTIIIVTHKLDEVRAVANDVTVLRAGKTVATFAANEPFSITGPDGRKIYPDDPYRGARYQRFDVKAIARAMVGADLPAPTDVPAPPRETKMAFHTDNLTVGTALREVILQVREGEIVGIAGVDGNGQRELAHAIAGLTPYRGRVCIGTHEFLVAGDVAARLRAGLAHIPEDRHHGGLVLDASVEENLVLGRADITGRFVIDRARVEKFVTEQVRELDIRPPDPHALVRSLSGGNQQKVVVARELSRPALKAVLAVQPTRGVDLGAVARIHDHLRAVARAGAGVLVISADLDELLGLCHRVHVLLRGRIVGDCRGDDLRKPEARAQIGKWMTGARDDDEDAA